MGVGLSENVPAPDGVALLDANLSALDIYARPLSDLVLARLAEATSDPQPSIFLGLADGVAALRPPESNRVEACRIDTSGPAAC
jgi:hypothetical protein